MFTNFLRDGSVPQTPPVPKESQLPNIADGFRVHYGIVIAIVLAIVLYYFMFYTSAGFKLRAVGMNPVASRFNGFAVNKIILFSFICSGAIAGLGGSIELHGKQFRLMQGYGSGFGFDGVAIALIAQLNPIGSVIVAIFFGILRKGASTLQAGMKIPNSVVDIIQALVIVFAVAGTALIRLPQVKQFFRTHFGKGAEK